MKLDECDAVLANAREVFEPLNSKLSQKQREQNDGRITVNTLSFPIS